MARGALGENGPGVDDVELWSTFDEEIGFSLVDAFVALNGTSKFDRRSLDVKQMLRGGSLAEQLSLTAGSKFSNEKSFQEAVAKPCAYLMNQLSERMFKGGITASAEDVILRFKNSAEDFSDSGYDDDTVAMVVTNAVSGKAIMAEITHDRWMDKIAPYASELNAQLKEPATQLVLRIALAQAAYAIATAGVKFGWLTYETGTLFFKLREDTTLSSTRSSTVLQYSPLVMANPEVGTSRLGVDVSAYSQKECFFALIFQEMRAAMKHGTNMINDAARFGRDTGSKRRGRADLMTLQPLEQGEKETEAASMMVQSRNGFCPPESFTITTNADNFGQDNGELHSKKAMVAPFRPPRPEVGVLLPAQLPQVPRAITQTPPPSSSRGQTPELLEDSSDNDEIIGEIMSKLEPSTPDSATERSNGKLYSRSGVVPNSHHSFQSKLMQRPINDEYGRNLDQAKPGHSSDIYVAKPCCQARMNRQTHPVHPKLAPTPPKITSNDDRSAPIPEVPASEVPAVEESARRNRQSLLTRIFQRRASTQVKVTTTDFIAKAYTENTAAQPPVQINGPVRRSLSPASLRKLFPPEMKKPNPNQQQLDRQISAILQAHQNHRRAYSAQVTSTAIVQSSAKIRPQTLQSPTSVLPENNPSPRNTLKKGEGILKGRRSQPKLDVTVEEINKREVSITPDVPSIPQKHSLSLRRRGTNSFKNKKDQTVQQQSATIAPIQTIRETTYSTNEFDITTPLAFRYEESPYDTEILSDYYDDTQYAVTVFPDYEKALSPSSMKYEEEDNILLPPSPRQGSFPPTPPSPLPPVGTAFARYKQKPIPAQREVSYFDDESIVEDNNSKLKEAMRRQVKRWSTTRKSIDTGTRGAGALRASLMMDSNRAVVFNGAF